MSVAVCDGLFDLQLRQRGMLRALRSAELSDGTLRFLLWAAALLSPQRPSLMVLNEPETSLHPQLLGPLAGLITAAARNTQVVVVSHSDVLVQLLGTVSLTDAADADAVRSRVDQGPRRDPGGRAGHADHPGVGLGQALGQRCRAGRSARVNTRLAWRMATL